MRLFVGLDIPEPIRIAMARYVDEMRRIAPDVKWVRTDSYHVTLKFIGEWKRDVREVISALEKIKASPVDIAFRGSGFFPSERAPRVFWVGIEGDQNFAPLAHKVEEACSTISIPTEDREFSPHLTLARSGSGSPRPKPDEQHTPGMKRFAERIAGMSPPDFGTMHATEFFLYESKLSPGGAQYSKLKSFGLGDSS
jgi:2'-5' RNA ligase